MSPSVSCNSEVGDQVAHEDAPCDQNVFLFESRDLLLVVLIPLNLDRRNRGVLTDIADG